MKRLTDIASYDDAVLLKRIGFNFPTRFYYHTHYSDYYDNVNSMEATGDYSYSFYNKYNSNRAACPYFWQILLWVIIHPLKGFNALKTKGNEK